MAGYAALLDTHIIAGTAGLALGPLVAWADARHWRSARELGAWYLGIVVAVGITATGLVIVKRTDLWWLIPVSVLTVTLAVLGRYAYGRPDGWTHAYVHGLGGSYIALLTATVVVAFALDGPLYGPAELIAWLTPTAVIAPLLELWRRKTNGGPVYRSTPGRRSNSC
ncbi:hypothetical protein [Nocardia acidivorans]|uniref:hypothetical protein n=1 Tax=Nocardia acidivorans TaxID=404580 RepID=UPI00083291AC|nr:hypothetical protein [Nocardia acidivorans]